MSRNAFDACEREYNGNKAMREHAQYERSGGAQAQLEEVCNEAAYLREMVVWSYSKLHGRTFSNMDDALMLDRINLYLQHGIAG